MTAIETPIRIDWFEATLECETVTLLTLAAITDESYDGMDVVSYGKGRHGYQRSIIYRSTDLEFTVLDLGNGGYPHIIGSGQHAETVRRIALSLNVRGRVSRIDLACDSTEGWIPAEKRVLRWADEHPKSSLLAVGDFYRQEKGRTYYVGAASSDRRVRVYEKGIQLGENPDWVRVELQYRPKGKPAKEWAFKASLDELSNSSRVFVALRANQGFYSPPLYERSGREPMIALARQYGRTLQEHTPEAYRIILDYLRNDWSPSE